MIGNNGSWTFGLDGFFTLAENNNLNGTCVAIFDDDVNGFSAHGDKASLYSPIVDNTNDSIVILEFDYNFKEFSIFYNDSFYVDIYDGNVWVRILSLDSNDCGHYTSVSCTSFPHFFMDLTQYKNAQFQIRFSFFDGNDWVFYVGIDNVRLYEPLATKIAEHREKSNGVIVYPNPSKDQLYLEGNITGTEAQMFNFSGQLVRNFHLDQNAFRQSINLESLKSGLYFLTIIGKDVRQQMKIVKQ